MQPIAPEILLVLHETPVYVPEKGGAFVDAVDRQLREWYRVKGCYVENEAGQRFHLDAMALNGWRFFMAWFVKGVELISN